MMALCRKMVAAITRGGYVCECVGVGWGGVGWGVIEGLLYPLGDF